MDVEMLERDEEEPQDEIADFLQQAYDLAEEYGKDVVAFAIPDNGEVKMYATPQAEFLLPQNQQSGKIDRQIKWTHEKLKSMTVGSQFKGKVPNSSAPREHKLYYAQASFPDDPVLSDRLATLLVGDDLPTTTQLRDFLIIEELENGDKRWTCKFPHGRSIYHGSNERTTTFTSETGAFLHLRQFDIVVDQYVVEGVLLDAWACGGSCGLSDCKQRFDGPLDLQMHQKHGKRAGKRGDYKPQVVRKTRTWENMVGSDDETDAEEVVPAKKFKGNGYGVASGSRAKRIIESDDEMED